MENSRKPRNWQEVRELQDSILNNIGSLVVSTQNETQEILKYVSCFSDGSGVVDACIQKFPEFVPHVQKLREYYHQLDDCYKCINNNKWLQSQPEWNKVEKEDDEEDDGSSGGKKQSIVDLFSAIETEMEVLGAVNLDVKLLMNITYNLQHNQNKYYNKTAIRDLAQNLAKNQEKNKAQIEELVQAKGKGGISM